MVKTILKRATAFNACGTTAGMMIVSPSSSKLARLLQKDLLD
jgi:hypothetical protein